MRHARRLFWGALLLALPGAILGAQPRGASAAGGAPAGAAARDSLPFPFAVLVEAVLARHPVAQQARLVAQQARNELRVAWGAFDPTFTATWDQKVAGGVSYYNYLDAELKIPLPIGADVTVAFDRTLGKYANPDRRTDGVGTLSAGVSIPLGQRIITDERRTALAVARAARDAGIADQGALVNKLLWSAAKAYGTWYEGWQRRAVAAEGEALAAFRLQAVRERVRNGESAPIDSAEALLELQRRQVTRIEAENAWYLATLGVTALLWTESGAPAALPDGAYPTVAGVSAAVDSSRLAAILDDAARRHPDLLKQEARVRQAEAQRLLTTQQLLPFAEAKVAGVADRGEGVPPLGGERLADNYKGALTVRTPLVFARESGRWGAAGDRLGIQRLERDRLRRDVELDVRGAVFDLAALEQLLVRQRETVRLARLLRDAEQRRFENGESTLLVVNLRERLVLDESVKLAALEAKVVGARGALVVATGNPSLLGTAP